VIFSHRTLDSGTLTFRIGLIRGVLVIDLRALPEQQRLELLVNAIHDYAIYMLDTEGRIATWNPGAERFKGYRAEEVIGEHFERFFTTEDRSADVPRKALRVAAREGRFETEGWRVRKDGSKFWAHVVLDAIRAGDGSLIGFAKITRDVTARKEAETALYESEQRFRMLVQGVRDYAIYMLDRTGQVTNWNAGAQRIKGYSEGEIVGRHFSQFYTEADRAGGEPDRALKIALTEGKYEREAWRVRKDGSLFWAHVLIDPIFDDEGQHIGFAKITRDITDQKRARDELENAQQALAQSQKLQALGELTGGIAHDFNNLMTVISGSADFLRRNRDLPEEKKLRYLDGIIETAERATTLTSQLLAFGRRQPVQPHVLNVADRLESARELLARTLGSKFTLVVDAPTSELKIEVDAAQFEAAIVNCLVNARDAMPAGGKITLAAAEESRDGIPVVRVSVADTGLGMPARVQERAFDPFFTTKEVGKGTGLGLSQIYGFAAQAGGVAEIQSAEGIGTTVSMIIPRSDKPVVSAIGKNVASDGKLSLSILLVEDNDQVRAFTRDMLRDAGCAVVEVSSAAEAIQELDDKQVDLVLSDVVMPGKSGVEFANEVRIARPNLPVILMTGYSDELVESGVNFPFLAKPFTSKDLRAVIESSLATASANASRSQQTSAVF
jgi:PAS domain S-box-containing protein